MSEPQANGAEPTFEADVSIGGTLRYIDRNGSCLIDGGRLILRKRDGTVIADAPMDQISAWTNKSSAGGAVRMLIDGTKYTVEPLRSIRANSLVLEGSARNLARDVARLKKGRELTQVLLSIVEAEGGHVGKP
jgi:hypothetical protein